MTELEKANDLIGRLSYRIEMKDRQLKELKAEINRLKNQHDMTSCAMDDLKLPPINLPVIGRLSDGMD